MTETTRPLLPADPRQMGPYELTGRLGEGGMGTVYLARNASGRQVAVKIIKADLAHEDEFRSRFRSEVERAREVPPFCTAEVLDADPDHETPYLVVEYVDGPSLAAVVAERGPLTASNLHGVAIGVATALTAIHGAGVIHRDLKPSNVLLAPGSPKVIDFGIARAVQGADGPTRTNQMIGTVTYMAPERLEQQAGRSITPAADVFAWGAVVAYAGTGRTPFAAEMPYMVAVRILTAEPDLDGLGGPLRDLVAQTLAKDPAARPSARDVLDRLLTMSPHRAGSPAAVLDRQPALRQAVAEARAATDVHPARELTERAALAAPGAEAPAGDVPVVPGPGAATTRFHSLGSAPASPTSPAGSVSPTSPTSPAGSVSPTSPAGSVSPTSSVGAPAAPTVPGLSGAAAPVPHPTRRRGRIRTGVLAVTAVIALVLLAGVASGRIPLTGPAGGDRVAVRPSTPASAAAPEPSTTAAPLFTESLTVAGRDWPLDENPNEKATCRIDEGLVVEKRKNGPYRCKGTRREFGDIAATVKVTLHNAASCAGVWFRFKRSAETGEDAGYVLRVCDDTTTLLVHGAPTPSTMTVLDTFPHATPAPVGETVTVGVTALGDRLTFTLDGQRVGEREDPSFTAGRVVLGILGKKSAQPPFRVSYTDLTIGAT